MGTLTETDPTAREFVTEILDKALLWNILKVVIQFLLAPKMSSKSVQSLGLFWIDTSKENRRHKIKLSN